MYITVILLFKMQNFYILQSPHRRVSDIMLYFRETINYYPYIWRSDSEYNCMQSMETGEMI